MATERETRAAYMREAGHFDPRARRGEPGSFEDFEALSDSAQCQIVYANAERRLKQFSESNPGLPLVTPDDAGWADAALADLQFTGGRTGMLDDYQPLRENGVPLVDPDGASPVARTTPEMLQSLAECGVPLRGRVPQRRELAPLAALVDVGVPMREAVPPSMAMPDSRRADERPHHEIAKDLDTAIGPDHPDRDHLPALLAAGAALTIGQKDLIDALAAKHSAALQDLRGDSPSEPFGESGSIEAALREAGIPIEDCR